ncbi:sortase A [Enterococcus sp. AZ194]|uniref:class A sortase n=1 Tax=Enterococcus sp. AZ194 TaxID=2774629 RepID=UPI003F26B65F
MKTIKLSKKQKEIFVELAIDFLLVLGIGFIFSPWLKDSLIGWQIQRTEIVQNVTLPSKQPMEESIGSPKLSSILTNSFQHQKEGYGSVWIPSIGLEQPILIGITNENLLYGGVVMYPERTLKADNFVLFGHHLGINELLFGKLLDIKERDQVVVNYLDETIAYEVSELTIVDETEISVLENKEDARLTLITCPVPQRTKQRFVVIAQPVKEEQQKQVQQELKNQVDILQKVSQKQSMSKTEIYKFPFGMLCLCLFLIGLIRFLFYKKKITQKKMKEN